MRITKTRRTCLAAGLGAILLAGIAASQLSPHPDGISLSYTPDRKSYLLGQPIDVHFVMENDGVDPFPFEEGGDYRGATRQLRFAFTAVGPAGEASDPRPGQTCFGGISRFDPTLAPGETYDQHLPLLAYLKFPHPGTYTVTAYQALGFGVAVEGLEEAGWQDYAYGGRFEIELVLPSRDQALALARSSLAIEEAHQRRRAFAFLTHPVYLEPLRSLLAEGADGEDSAALIVGVGSILTPESTVALLELAESPRAAARVAALRQLADRLPMPDPSAVVDGRTFHGYRSAARRRETAATWNGATVEELWQLLEKALGSPAPEEVAIAARALVWRGDAAVVELLARAADRLAPGDPIAEAHRPAVYSLGNAAWSLARFFAARPVAVDETSSPGRLVVWANLRHQAAASRPGDEALLLRMLGSKDPLLRQSAIRWLPADFARGDEIPWRELLCDTDHQVWWYAVQAARKFPLAVEAARRCLEATEDAMKRRDLEELLAAVAE